MKTENYQFLQFTPAEFEDLRTKLSIDMIKVADRIDYVASTPIVIGATYSRNQNVLNIAVTLSDDFLGEESAIEADLKSEILRIVDRDDVAETPVQQIPVQTPRDRQTGMVINPSGFATPSEVQANAPKVQLATKLKAALEELCKQIPKVADVENTQKVSTGKFVAQTPSTKRAPTATAGGN